MEGDGGLGKSGELGEILSASRLAGAKESWVSQRGGDDGRRPPPKQVALRVFGSLGWQLHGNCYEYVMQQLQA